MVNLDLGIDLENAGGVFSAIPGLLRGAVAASGIIAAVLTQDHALAGQITANGNGTGTVTQTHVMATAISAAAGITGDIAGTPSPDAMFSALTVQPNGWELDGTVVGVVTGGTYNGLNDNVAPGMVLEVSSKSWTSAGAQTTVTRNIYALAVTRQVQPNQALLEETASGSDVLTTWALSQRVFATDTIVKATLLAGFFTDNGTGGANDNNLGGENAATNSSTLAYYDPQAVWLSPNLERITATSYKPRLFVMHRAAQQGQPVRAVKFTATDESANSITQTVSTLTTGQYAGSGRYTNWYEPNFDLSSLTDGDLVTIDAVIYPWVGDSYTLSTDAETYPSVNLTVLKVQNDAGNTFGRSYAAVDGVGAGTPAVSSVAATADLTPYATHGAAATAIEAYNLANYGRGNLDGGVIRHLTGVTTSGTGALNTQTFGKGELLITGLNRATSIIDDTTTSNQMAGKIRFENITLKKSGGNAIFLRGANTTADQITFDQVTFAGTGIYNAWLYRLGREYFIDCDGDYVGQGNIFSTSIQGTAMIVGSKWPILAAATVACGTGAAKPVGKIPANLGTVQGRVYAFNFYTNSDAGIPVFSFGNADLGPRGICFVGNICELYGNSGQPALQISADGDVTPNINMNVAMCTLVGGTGTTNPLASGRANLFYQDTGTVLVNKDGITRHNIYSTRNTKSDVFATNGALIGNWAMRHHVDCGYDFIDLGDSSGDTTPSPSSWLGEGLGDLKTEMGVSDVVTGNPDFTNDQSGAGTGNGDYSLGGLTDVPQIPAGETMFAVDLFGTAIPTDGTARAGAVQ